MKKNLIFAVLAAFLAAGMLSSCKKNVSEEHEHAEEEYERGPQGGRLFEAGDFALEVTIFESGVPPEFRVFPYSGGKAIAPGEVTLSIELRRLGGRTDRINFAPESGCLRGQETVEEPHSFEAKVTASWKERDFEWSWEQIEGRTRISPEAAREAGIVAEQAGPAVIREKLRLKGTVAPNGDRLAHVHPRYAGIARSVRVSLGDRVAAGDVLAVIQSNESLSNYPVHTEIRGTVIGRHITPGEYVTGETEIFTIADLESVWLELAVYRSDFGKLKAGQKVTVHRGNGEPPTEATLSYVSSTVDEDTQSLLTRAVLPNPKGEWRPGMFVEAEVFIGERRVPLAIRSEAIQSFRDWQAVFARFGEDTYEVRPIETGATDGEWTEVLSGIEPGTFYAAKGSFVVKADVLKAGASHDH
ncbi:MAG: efflux RND transporter periplasmic adaptor subunit [Bdellovibrionota bacterium]